MMQNWAQYVKKTVRFHPKAEDLPQQLTGSQHQHLQQQQQDITKTNQQKLTHFGYYLGSWCIVFKTDFCVETMTSSRSI